ncbi:unnamed protein product [Ilex paraguariensis]|uniref:RRM domain-containing protein n=1 Tax=Ilex paraguariensis TaxID=185542 RepID=A0ABC8S3H2_9AQUA
MDLIKKRKLDENGVVLVDPSDGGPNKLTLEDARKIIEPFTQEQLFEIVQNAAVRHLDVLDAVRSIADRDHTQRKLFIRGLGWDTTTEKLRAIFSAYGELEEAVVILDKATGKSKGYGFITFKHIDGALLSLKEPSKKIDGRMTVTQLASAGMSGGPTGNSNSPDISLRKIYVANVPYDMSPDRLLVHFSMYGEIEEGPLGFDKATGKSKGFALFVYKTPEAARASLVDPIKNIDGHQLNCKLAIDGKKGKVGPGGGQAPTGIPVEAHGDGVGLNQPASVPGSQFGGPGGLGGYGGFSGGLQGPSPLGQGHHPLNSSLGGPGLSSLGSQGQSTLGISGGFASGLGGPYSGSHYGGPGSSAYSGLGSAGGGVGGAGRGSSLYGLPPSSGGITSGDYPQSAHYSLSSAAYQSQHNQAAGASPVPRVPHGGLYQGLGPYY